MRASAQCESVRLDPSPGAAIDLFGSRVSIGRDTIAVGCYLDDEAGHDAGAAYVFVPDGAGWRLQQKLIPTEVVAGDQVRDVDLSEDGNTLVVGAYRGESAYIFTRTGERWSQAARLVAGDGPSNARFGLAVALDSAGDTALVGAAGDDEAQSNAGAAYVFERSERGWLQRAKLFYPVAAAWHGFGAAVDLSGDGMRAVIGSSENSASIFRLDAGTWLHQRTFTLSSGFFGSAVSLSQDGRSVLVGAWGAAEGRAHLYRLHGGTWLQEAQLTAPDQASGHRFGSATALSADGRIALVGAFGAESEAGDTGAAYVFVDGEHGWEAGRRVPGTAGLPPTAPWAWPTS